MAREIYRDVDVICRFSKPVRGETYSSGRHPRIFPLRIRRNWRREDSSGGRAGPESPENPTPPAFRVVRVTCHWVSMCGAFPQFHLSALVHQSGAREQEVMELVFDAERLLWSERISATAFAGPVQRLQS